MSYHADQSILLTTNRYEYRDYSSRALSHCLSPRDVFIGPDVNIINEIRALKQFQFSSSSKLSGERVEILLHSLSLSRTQLTNLYHIFQNFSHLSCHVCVLNICCCITALYTQLNNFQVSNKIYKNKQNGDRPIYSQLACRACIIVCV